MRHELVGRGLRALRHRRHLRQRDSAARARIARSVLADLEAGRIGSHSVDALTRAAEASGGSIRIDLVVPGGDLRRLLDADHAAVQSGWKGMLARVGWVVDAEVTFNHYGERGSIDLFAWHAGTRTLLVIEIKTVIVDIQDLLSGIDRKVRIGRRLAAERGWHPRAVIPMLLVSESSTARRRIKEHGALFERFALRGRAAIQWLRRPNADVLPAGILCLTSSSRARLGDRRRAGRQRIRGGASDPRSDSSVNRSSTLSAPLRSPGRAAGDNRCRWRRYGRRKAPLTTTDAVGAVTSPGRAADGAKAAGGAAPAFRARLLVTGPSWRP